jgi:hypothetical protein
MRSDPAAAGAQPIPATATPEPEPAPKATGVSEFLGGVLSQLSFSSWLPATMLVGEGAVLLQLRSQHNANIGDAIEALAGMKWGALVVLLFALILSTMITQAFEFEVIRLLEGYIDLRTRWIQAVVDARIRRYRSKRQRMLGLFQNRKEAAFAEALPTLAEKFDPGFIAAVREAATEDPPTVDVSDDDRADAAAFDWQQFAGSPAVYKLTSLHTLLWDYPAEHRIMPTRLGNVLRAAEDRLESTGGDLEGFVIRNHDRLPAMLRDQHREYRTRLDMYCSLTLIFSILAVASVVLLWPVGSPWAVVLFTGLNAGLAAVAYEAAVASARGYGVALREIDRFA